MSIRIKGKSGWFSAWLLVISSHLCFIALAGQDIQESEKASHEAPRIVNPFSLFPGIPDPETVARSLHVASMRGIARWDLIEPKPGCFNWNSITDQWLHACVDNGMDFIPSIRIGRGWFTQGRNLRGSKQASFPPDDLAEDWNPKWGYSKNYFKFIYSFVDHYKDSLPAIIIENEANAPQFWAGTKEEYIRILKTAYLAAHLAKPEIIVMDYGIASGAFGPVMIRDMFESSEKKPEEILDFANRFFAKYKEPRFRWDTPESLRSWAMRKDYDPHYERITYFLKHGTGARDWLAIHYYEDVNFLDDVIGWIREKLPEDERSIPIAITEYGIRNLDPEYEVSGLDQAREVCKKLIIGLALDMKLMVWYSLKEDSLDKLGLLESDGSWRPAAKAYNFIAKKIGQELEFVHGGQEGDSPRRFVFKSRTDPARMLEVIWSDDGAVETPLLRGTDAAKPVFYSVIGEPIAPRRCEEGYTLEVTSSPVFVEYIRDPSLPATDADPRCRNKGR
ncbi:MAG: endo-1,4-beta-xylanase [Planctomycetes bacterium]|nr:endo-1,4-beta-xylanase [Planctomycetota bacterium]